MKAGFCTCCMFDRNGADDGIYLRVVDIGRKKYHGALQAASGQWVG